MDTNNDSNFIGGFADSLRDWRTDLDLDPSGADRAHVSGCTPQLEFGAAISYYYYYYQLLWRCYYYYYYQYYYYDDNDAVVVVVKNWNLSEILIENTFLRIETYLWCISVNKTFSETFLPYFLSFYNSWNFTMSYGKHAFFFKPLPLHLQR